MTKSGNPPEPASRRDFLWGAAAGVSTLPVMHSGATAAQLPSDAEVSVMPQTFGAAGDSSRDDSEAIQRALDQSLATGRPLRLPPGRYRVDRPINIRPGNYLPYLNTFAPGPRIIGSGAGRTIFESRVNGPLFDLDSDADHTRKFQAVLGSVFEGFTINGGNIGIQLRTALNTTIRDVHIIGLSGTAVKIVCLEGDMDGSNMVSLEQVRIENCAGWGIESAAASGHNEISFLHLKQVFIQGCGRASSGTVPQSGGMKWKGQICTLDQCAFTINENVALFIPGEAGLAQTVNIQSTAFENNKRRHILCTGVSTFNARNIQFYSNDDYKVAVACEFDGSRNTVRFVDIDGVTVRATVGNNGYAAFRIAGVHAEFDNCRVRNVAWDNFDYPGQARFQGWQFDPAAQCCELQIASGGAIFGPVGRGNKTPLRLRGGNGGTPSTTGEWVEAHISSPLVLNARLAPGSRYQIYLFDDRGVKRLEASTTGAVLDPASGYLVKESDLTRLLVGRLETDAAGRARTIKG